MSRKQIARMAFDPEHKRLMAAYRNATGGHKTKALAALRAYVTACLEAA